MNGSNDKPGRTRRREVLGGIGVAITAGLPLAAPYVAKGAAALQKVRVSIGRIPWAAMNSPVSQYMINNKLLETAGAKLGYDINIDWRAYPTAMPMVDAIVSNNLDMGMWGNTPINRALSAELPISLMVIGEGHLRFLICTKAGSKIHTIEDLRGKTVGGQLGGDPYFALTQMLRYNLGSPEPSASGIRIVNTPTLAIAAEVPAGMDASDAIYPAYLAAESTGTVAIMNSYGYTEPYYEGPLGKGAGILIPTVKKSPFYPEGYYLHRSFWLVNNRVIDKNPKVVLAFIIAQQQAVVALKKMDPGAVSQLVKEYWKLDADAGAKAVKDDLLTIRGWSWPTESDAWAVLKVSQFMAEEHMVAEPSTWKTIKNSFARTAPLVKQAYEYLGSYPPANVFTDPSAPDLRGLPVWQMDQWKERS
jgi:ABC-type nitrate/sulfonate/bicarbonate transport system substrate-binding protein